MDTSPSLSSVTIAHVRAALERRRLDLADEMRHYPTPIAGCDQYFNGLLEQYHALRRRLQQLDAACAEARGPEDLARRVGELMLERGPEEFYPHDTVHSHEPHEVGHGQGVLLPGSRSAAQSISLPSAP
jgi:hypothetical protein